MSKKVSKQDEDLFKQAMRGVKPLKPHAKVTHVTARPKPKRIQQPNFDEPEPLAISREPEVSSEDQLSFNHAGLQPKTLRRLKRGQILPEAELDLHGYTINQAEAALRDFLLQAVQQGLYCVRIIHGKGYSNPLQTPILKNQVNQWLRAHPSILAFCSAQPKHGGTGALYVLLKKNKSPL